MNYSIFRLFLLILVIIGLESQQPLWCDCTLVLSVKRRFEFTYKASKEFVIQIIWSLVFIFYYLHR
nr:hypothetical chloroplast RF47 [Rhipidosiphon lewmanomontiae]